MQTTSALDTALNQDRVALFIATKIETPARTVLLVDGSGEVAWSQGTFVASDAVWGTLDNIDQISDGMDEEAPALSLRFIPDNAADVSVITNPANQNSRVRVWLGALNLTTGAVVADPYQLFDGIFDVPTLSINASDRRIDLECASSFERLFSDDEGNRLNPACHKAVWPGETGLDAITGIVRQVIWGPGDKISGSAPGSSIGGSISGGGVTSGGVGGAYGGMSSDGVSRMYINSI